MLDPGLADNLRSIIERNLVRTPIAGAALASRQQAFLDDLSELLRYEELRPSQKDRARELLDRIKALSGELADTLEQPIPELYGALLELTAVQGGRRSQQPLEALRGDLELLQRAASTAQLDAYRKAGSKRSGAIVRFLSYRIAVLMDSHFGEGTATEVRGRLYDQVLRTVLRHCGIAPPADLTSQIMPQALRVLRADQASLRTSATPTG